MENRSHALAAGIFVILLGLAAALAVFYLSGKRDISSYYILETRRNVTGLNTQAQVRYRGIRAGKVESIDIDDNDPRLILVRISLDQKYRLTRGTTAQLDSQGITGIAYIKLEDPGTDLEALPGDDDHPPHIPLKAAILDTLSESAGDIAAQIGAVSARLNILLDDKNMKNLARAMENMATASEGLKQLPEIMGAMKETLSATNIRRMNSILDHLEKTMGEAAPLTGEMREMVKSMTSLSRRADQLAIEAGPELTAQTLPRANALMQELTGNARQMSRILETLEGNPQALIFGNGPPRPGPGEKGFAAPKP
ncbi:MAG: MCE family protein [Betaproteobacteria bacterium HGW-Betaproteobacteria-11]|nr:MAG: MCE family protein [Betaproteobacteria bacterium HGW-Betaproteobacteria-11]